MTTIREIIDTPDNVPGAHKALYIGREIESIQAASKKCPACGNKMSACTCKGSDSSDSSDD